MPSPNIGAQASVSVDEYTTNLAAAFRITPAIFDLTVNANRMAALASIDLYHAYEVFQAAADHMALAIIERASRKGVPNV